MTLSRTESATLRALAIIGIFLHNYCHFMPWAVKENEYTFKEFYPQALLRKIENLDSNLFVHLFSFFGHYGVPVFLFLSGFGLVMKYERNNNPQDFGSFAKYNYLKLLKLLLPGFALFLLLYYGLYGNLNFLTLPKIVAQLTMTINLWEHAGAAIKPGPYWYFGLTLQLYLVYRAMLYNRGNRRVIILMTVCVLMQLLLLSSREMLDWYRYNFMGGALPFCMGILFARYGENFGKWKSGILEKKALLAVLLIVSCALVFVCSFNAVAWTFVPAFVCIAAICLIKTVPALVCRPLAFVGSISAAIFVFHPHMREIFLPIAKSGSLYTGLAAYTVATIVVAAVYNRLLRFCK